MSASNAVSNVSTSNPSPAVRQTGRPASAAAAAWDIDSAHSSAGFKVRHLMVSNVRGHLGAVSGTVVLDQGDLTRSRVEVSIDARGIDTREPKRDEHLRSPDFLDVANHPLITFRSTAIEVSQPDDPSAPLTVKGELTIRGVTRPVTLQVDGLPVAVTDPWGNTKRGTTARTSINRKDFGLTWNVALEAGGVMVADRVDIEIEVQLASRKV